MVTKDFNLATHPENKGSPLAKGDAFEDSLFTDSSCVEAACEGVDAMSALHGSTSIKVSVVVDAVWCEHGASAEATDS